MAAVVFENIKKGISNELKILHKDYDKCLSLKGGHSSLNNIEDIEKDKISFIFGKTSDGLEFLKFSNDKLISKNSNLSEVKAYLIINCSNKQINNNKSVSSSNKATIITDNRLSMLGINSTSINAAKNKNTLNKDKENRIEINNLKFAANQNNQPINKTKSSVSYFGESVLTSSNVINLPKITNSFFAKKNTSKYNSIPLNNDKFKISKESESLSTLPSIYKSNAIRMSRKKSRIGSRHSKKDCCIVKPTNFIPPKSYYEKQILKMKNYISNKTSLRSSDPYVDKNLHIKLFETKNLELKNKENGFNYRYGHDLILKQDF